MGCEVCVSNEFEFLGVLFSDNSSSASKASEFLGVFRGGSSGGIARSLVDRSDKKYMSAQTDNEYFLLSPDDGKDG